MNIYASKLTRIPTNCPRCRRSYFTTEPNAPLQIGDLIPAKDENSVDRFYGGEIVMGVTKQEGKLLDVYCPECEKKFKACVERGIDRKAKEFVHRSKLATFDLSNKDLRDCIAEDNR